MQHAFRWSVELLRRGVLVHPWHNWFLSAAHTEADIDLALQATERAFALVQAQSYFFDRRQSPQR